MGGSPKQATELAASPLMRLRLLIALDALLVEGSVTRAAGALDMGVPAMSRLLSQLRTMYGDPLVVRAGRALVPTPFAEQLRERVRALSDEARELMLPKGQEAAPPRKGVATSQLPLVAHPPLAISPIPTVEGQPDLAIISRRLADIDGSAAPKQRLARYIATVGAGVGQSRPLTIDEAKDAMRIILDGEADPIQIGALLVAIRYRGATAGELAGMVGAARRNCLPLDGRYPAADLDWPSYRSPRIESPPWFLLSARLIAMSGHRVALHGIGHSSGVAYEIRRALGIPECGSIADVSRALESGGIAFLPLVAIDPQIQALISLYRLLEMRSPLSLVVPLLNPMGATSTVTGVPSMAGRKLHSDAAALLGWKRLVAIGSNRDVAQATPSRPMPLTVLDGAQSRDIFLPSSGRPRAAAPKAGLTAAEYCLGLWKGAVRNEHAVETVLSTTAVALMAVSRSHASYDEAYQDATRLWNQRDAAR